MELVATWTRDDRHNAYLFFSSPSGAKFLETLRINSPRVVGDHIEKRALTGTEKQTWENCLNAMAMLMTIDPEDRTSIDKLEQFDPNAFSSQVKTQPPN